MGEIPRFTSSIKDAFRARLYEDCSKSAEGRTDMRDFLGIFTCRYWRRPNNRHFIRTCVHRITASTYAKFLLAVWELGVEVYFTIALYALYIVGLLRQVYDALYASSYYYIMILASLLYAGVRFSMANAVPVSIGGGWVVFCAASALGYRWYQYNFPWKEVEYEGETEYCRERRRVDRSFHCGGCMLGFGAVGVMCVVTLNLYQT